MGGEKVCSTSFLAGISIPTCAPASLPSSEGTAHPSLQDEAMDASREIDYETRPVRFVPEGENVWRVVWAD